MTRPLTQEPSGPLDELRTRLIVELRDRLIDQAVSLPLGNQAALMRIVALCQDDSASAAAIAEEAALDEGLAATLLRVANSASLGGASRAEDLTAAVARLGLRLVECLAISAPCLRLLAAPADGLEEQRQALHQHAVLTGVAARALAPAGIHPDRALAAGLVHNLGLSVLSLQAKSGFRKLVESAAQGEQIPDAETRLFGFTHAELGALLATQWSFPDSIVKVVREHDAPDPHDPLTALIQVVDLLLRAAGVGVEPPLPVPDGAFALAGVARPAAEKLVQSLLAPPEDGQSTDGARLADLLGAAA